MLFNDEADVSKLRHLTIANSVQLGGWFTAIGRKVSARRGDAFAIVIIVNDDDEPELHFAGWNPNRLSPFEITRYTDHAGRALIDWFHQRSGDGDDEVELSPAEVMRDRWRRHLRVEQMGRERELEKRAGLPWRCEFCDAGYKTERGAERHERICLHSPPDGHGAMMWSWTNPAFVFAECRCGFRCTTPHVGSQRKEKHAIAVQMRTHFNEHISPTPDGGVVSEIRPVD